MISDDFYDFQKYASEWVVKTFGQDVLDNKRERLDRFLEESLELVQSCGYSQDDIYTLMKWVYSRPKGEIKQEVGGVATTLLTLCETFGINFIAAAMTELRRCYNNSDKIREKHNQKKLEMFK